MLSDTSTSCLSSTLPLVKKITSSAVTSNDDPFVPSFLSYSLGPPVSLSKASLPTTNTLEPFVRYLLQASACFPHAETLNHDVSSTRSPALLLYFLPQAMFMLVTASPF